MKFPFLEVEAIPHDSQRYETTGDYFKKKGKWFFRISTFKNTDYILLILIHEIVEWYLCLKNGVSERDITRFDTLFEKERKEGKWKNEEPGDDPRAPYGKYHKMATAIEMHLASILGVDWKSYTAEVIAKERTKW